MKSSKSSVKSFKNLISKTGSGTGLSPNKDFGLTVVPVGTGDALIALPSLKDTYTYNIINTDEMLGNITLRTSAGASLKGLILRSNGGSLSIDPIQVGTDELTLESDVKDGCYIQTVSNGNQWFIWSVATGGTISVRTGGVITTYTPTPLPAVYADITNVVITSDVRFVGSGLEARHDLTFSGQGEPNTTLTITEDGGAIAPIVITIPSDGNWTVTRSTNLPNATYTFDFNPTLGNGVQNQSFTGDTGPINFTVPSTFTPDPAEVVDFASEASAVKPDGTPIVVVVDSSAWNSSLVHGDTFDIIYSITDPAVNGGVTVSQTVTGTIVDDTPPAAPVISAASIANINELSANGTAEPNKTITLFQDNLPLSPTVTSDGAGNWSFGPVVLNFNSNFTLKAQASEDGVGNPNRSAFGEYSPAFNYVQPVTDTPTIGVDGEQTSVWTNTANSFTISGTTEIGATIDVLNGANPATLVSGPTVDGAGNWSATINVADESVTSLSAKATLAGHLQSQASSFQLNVDRVAPVITLTGGAQTVGLPNVDSSLDSGFSASDASSGVATETSNWDSEVSTTTEGTYTVTYNATDNAGNSATPVTRSVTVTTEVIVPVITNITVNGDGTFTVEGTVTGAFADNLTVQVTIDDSDSGTPVSVTSGAFTHTTSTFTPGTYEFKAKSINSAAQESSLSGAETATISVPDTTAPIIVITNDADDSVITEPVNITEGDSFAFTVTATDNVDGDISGNVIQGGDTLDTATAGTYNLTFDVSDAAGNPATTATLSVEVAAASAFIEDNSGFTGNVVGGEYIDTSSTQSGYATIALSSDGIIDYTAGEPTEDEFTISWWMNLDNSQAADNVTVAGRHLGAINGVNRNFKINLGGTATSGVPNPHFYFYLRATMVSNLDTGVAMGSTWTHCAVVCKSDGSQLVISAYLNGNKLPNTATKPLGTKLLLPEAYEDFGWGGNGQSGSTVKGQFDSMQIKDGVALSDGQIAAIAAQADRQMTIEEASQIDAEPPIITITKNSDSSNIADGDSITLNAGEVFENLYTIDITDNSGEVITPVISPAIDTNTITDYNAHTITATDSAGNSTQITINVRVIGLWTEKVENPVGAFYEDTNYSPSGITMVDGLSSDRYAIGAEMDGLIVNMANISTIGDGYEVIVNLRPVDTPISDLTAPRWTNLADSTHCPLMIGFLRQNSTYLFGQGKNIPINQTLSHAREWMAGVFYQTRFSNPAATGAQMAFFNDRIGSGDAGKSSSFLTLDPGISSQVLKDQVRQVKYIITLGIAGKMFFDIYTKLPTEQSWTTLVTGLYHTTKQNLHLAIVGQTYPNGSIVQDVSIQPLN